MVHRDIDIRVKLTEETFRKFCIFDMFRHQQRWLLPVLISMGLLTAALAILLFLPDQPGTIPGLLTGLGLAVPMLFFGLNLIQIHVQIAVHQLKKPKIIYTLRLNEEGVLVSNNQENDSFVILPWQQLGPAYQRKDCVYLYVNPRRALLLPDGQASIPDKEMWAYIKNHLGERKCASVRHN